jgi:Fic family protein
MNRETGHYQKLGNLDFFIPDPLPPKNPPFELTPELMILYGQAMQQLAKLNEMSLRIPNAERFLKAYVIKEALLSSAIEGVHTTIIDVFTQPVEGGKPNKETQLVLNYNKALDVALTLLREQGMPITNRIILSAHEALMSEGEGERANPGNYRQQPVRVGQLVPPPAHLIPELMSDLEKYINTDDSLPALIKAGLAHVQFETIHPFIDGNGRIGRLLIVLLLIDTNLLLSPILYPSYFFKKHHLEYYQRLDLVRTKGDFEGWIKYYLEGICVSSQDAYRRASDIELLEKNIIEQLHSDHQTARIHEQLSRALLVLFQFPVINAKELAAQLDKSYNAANKLIAYFVDKGILYEIGEKKRNKLFQFKQYLELLEKEY